MPDELALLVWASKTVFTAAALVSAGLALHAAAPIVERDAVPRHLRIAALFALGAALLFVPQLILLNAQLAGSLGGLLNYRTFRWIWRAYDGAAVAVGIGILLIAGGALVHSQILAAIGAASLVSSFALTGHVQMLDGRGYLVPLVALHAALAAFWVAAPITLWPTQRIQQRPLIDRLHRFTRIAVLAIPVLFLAGGWLALNIAGSLDALLTSAYGRLLLAKLVAAFGALLLGAANKQIVTTRVRTHFCEGIYWLRLTLIGDAALFTSAIGLVAWITTLAGPPDPQICGIVDHLGVRVVCRG